MIKKLNRKMGFQVIILIIALLLIVLLHKPIGRLVFMKEYDTAISDSAKEFEVPENLLCAVIWTESHFRADAVSSAGASGLMQMMPTTFEEMRHRLHLDGEGDIFAPEENIRCGAFYLRYLFDIFGDWGTVLAAYNGGLANVSNWLKNPLYSDDGITLKDIPIRETFDYVKKVHRAERIYSYFYDSENEED